MPYPGRAALRLRKTSRTATAVGSAKHQILRRIRHHEAVRSYNGIKLRDGTRRGKDIRHRTTIKLRDGIRLHDTKVSGLATASDFTT